MQNPILERPPIAICAGAVLDILQVNRRTAGARQALRGTGLYPIFRRRRHCVSACS
jgi:hypothetical protein